MPIVYKITNLINNKIYIGQSRENFKYYLGGGRNIRLAHKKYGKENFKKEILAEGDFNQEYLNDLEKHYIHLYNSTNDKIGYNIMTGGKYAHYTVERNLKISKTLTGRKMSEEYKQNCRLRTLGKKQSDETKLRHSISGLARDFGKPVLQYDLDGNLLKEWTSATRAANTLNYTQSCISKACRKSVIYKKNIWEFKANKSTASKK